jgi:hypothetical protein
MLGVGGVMMHVRGGKGKPKVGLFSHAVRTRMVVNRSQLYETSSFMKGGLWSPLG